MRWCYCRLRLSLSGVRHLATVRLANFFDVDLSFATVVTFYLSQAAADKLKAKFEAELPDGARVVSYRRPIRGWIPTLHDPEDDVYVYTITRTSREARRGDDRPGPSPGEESRSRLFRSITIVCAVASLGGLVLLARGNRRASSCPKTTSRRSQRACARTPLGPLW